MSTSCVKIVIVLGLILSTTVSGNKTSVFQIPKVKQVSSDELLNNCWSNVNLTCIKAVILDNIEDIWRKKEFRITDSVVIERIADLSPEDYGTIKLKSTEEGRRYGSDADQMLGDVGRFLTTHALRVDLWQLGRLRIERSQQNPENLEIILDMNTGAHNNNGKAKDAKMWKIIVPLIIGFKSTGALILAIIAVKIFLLKALVVSKVALLAAGFLVLKKFLSSMVTQHHSYLFDQHPIPYYNEHGLEGGLPSAYGYSNYGAAGAFYAAPTAHDSHGYGPTASGTLVAVEGDDLQAHFSTKIETNIKANTTNQTTPKKEGTHRKIFSPMKNRPHRFPVLTYRKNVDKGRSS